MLPAGHPYREIIGRVLRPGRYSGGEPNQVIKDPAGLTSRVALAFPDLYDIGMSHLGLKILYSLVNKRAGPRRRARLRALARHGGRAAQRGPAAAQPRERHAAGRLRHRRLLAAVRADLHEHPAHARARRHPPARSDRGEADPLVIAGGPVAFEPEPLAAFIDASSSATARRPCRSSCATGRPSRPRASPAPSACAAWPARPGATCPRSTPPRSTPTRDSPWSCAPADPALPFPHRQGPSSPTSTASPSPPTRRVAASERHLRSPQHRDRARLHRGLPLLPGGHDLPARARARARPPSSTRCCAACARRATTRSA